MAWSEHSSLPCSTVYLVPFIASAISAELETQTLFLIPFSELLLSISLPLETSNQTQSRQGPDYPWHTANSRSSMAHHTGGGGKFDLACENYNPYLTDKGL